ncbi:hypothetical protein JX265_001867 [Neoarthrinium moseri]|uniref:Uncharacterized protein n=1 Tax=Neoarthrinium moseri TaxID=1658444 RepID=A0A9Q0AVI4_9PEZI|nr:hypothetical protein JX265_001867 [Neoarthrinium moseri]
MKFFNYLTGFVSLASAVAALPSGLSSAAADASTSDLAKRDAIAIRQALEAAQAKAVALGDLFEAATDTSDVPGIEAAGDELVASINSAEDVAAASNPLTLIEALGFVNTVTSLQNTIDDLTTVVKAKKPFVVQVGYVDELLTYLGELQTATNAFGTTILTKVPAAARSIAQGYIDDLNASVADVITFYTS